MAEASTSAAGTSAAGAAASPTPVQSVASSSTTPAGKPKKPYVPPPPPKSKLLRFLGINFRAFEGLGPSRNTTLVLASLSVPFAAYFYDRYVADQIVQDYKRRVAHLAEVQMPILSGDGRSGDEELELRYPKKIWVMSTRVPDDFEEDRASRWFKTYVKPVLFSAGYDYSFLNGTAPGALGRRVREKIRLERVASTLPASSARPGEAGYLDGLDKRRHARALGLTVVVGRNTWKEYLWGLQQGWCTEFDAVKEERGDDGRVKDLEEELARDDTFAVLPVADEHAEGQSHMEERPKPITPGSLFPAASNFSFYNSPSSSSPSQVPTSTEPQSLIIPPASTIPAQPPVLILPYDHPLGYLRYWPIKMFKWCFFERYRAQNGCETALAIIHATLEQQSTGPVEDEATERSRGIRRIEPPKNVEMVIRDEEREMEQVKMIDTVSENKKKVRPEWKGNEMPVSGSRDLDMGTETEWHYRKTFSETPTSLLSQSTLFYKELPGRLATARELSSESREVTKEELKYPPPTEDELKAERLKKETRWRNDWQGWLMTRRGGKMVWDERFADLKILDLELAKREMERGGVFAKGGAAALEAKGSSTSEFAHELK